MPATPRPLRVLFLASNPVGTSWLQIDKEHREIRQEIRLSRDRDQVDFVTEMAVRPRDLLRHLNEHRPDIIHFSGHGTELEQLVLVNEHDQPVPVSKAALVGLFAAVKDNIRLVVLNSCYSKPQAEAIVESIDCAIGMRKSVGDKAAIVFAGAFYGAIGHGRSIADAFKQGLVAMQLEGISESDTPELIVKTGLNADDINLGAGNP